MEDNKLSKLIVEKDLDKDILFDILEKFIRINGEGGKIILLPDFSKLKYKDGIIVLLLAFKALKMLNLRIDEGAGPKEIHEICGINLSTVKNTLRDLAEEKFAISKQGKYSIPNFLLYSLKERFGNLELIIQKRPTAKKRGVSRTDLSKIVEILKTSPSESFSDYYDFLIQERGKYLPKCLIILKIAKEKFGIESLTTGEITHLLKNFLGVPMIHQSNITTALGSREALKYLFKEPIKGGKYSYKINAKGQEFSIKTTNKHQKK